MLDNLLTSHVALGNFDAAVPIALRMIDLEVDGQLANLVIDAEAAASGNWNDIFSALEGSHSVSPLVDGLAQAWAALGLGQMGQSLQSFDEVIETEGMRSYGLYHKALALAAVGDFEQADQLMVEQGGAYSARSAFAHAQILSQLGRNDDALDMLDRVFGRALDPTLSALKSDLRDGLTVPYDIVTDARQGMAETAFMVAELLRNETPDGYTLLYVRVAQYLDPQNTTAALMAADLLENLERYELANQAYALVPRDHPAYAVAETNRIDMLRRAGRADAAIEVGRSLSRSHPDLAFVHAKLADALRTNSQFEEAAVAYSRALDLYSDDDRGRWIVLYTRAITYHQLDEWPLAEADFRAALELNPDQPQVLNYLGYSLVERNEKLDEALEMIEKAVAAEPDNGAIVDSLGWVLFQLGRYDEAVIYMERAASLEAVDPIVNDHLGDVYWAVGREIEATFQWNRALSFDPEPELAERIRQKLELGLDAVLIAEGMEPIRVANDDP